jgi:hypothetical protein
MSTSRTPSASARYDSTTRCRRAGTSMARTSSSPPPPRLAGPRGPLAASTRAWLPRGPRRSARSLGPPRPRRRGAATPRPSFTASAMASSVIGMRGTSAPMARRSSLDSTGLDLGDDARSWSAARSHALRVRSGTHVDLEQEAIELRLGQRVGALLLDGVARREHLERLGQPVRARADGDLALLHGLEQRRLRLRRRAVDLVGEHQVVEDRARRGSAARGPGLLGEHVGAGDVRGQQIGGELHAAERQVERASPATIRARSWPARARPRAGRGPSRERDEHRVDDLVLAHDGLRDHRLQGDDGFARPREQLRGRPLPSGLVCLAHRGLVAPCPAPSKHCKSAAGCGTSRP